MKKLVLIFALIFIGIGYTYSQTTPEEYKYFTRIYKPWQPLQPGYRLELITTVNYSVKDVDRVFNFKKIIRTNSNETIAILMEVVKITEGAPQFFYYCIPQKDSSDIIWNSLLDIIDKINEKEDKKAFVWALTQYISTTIAN